MNTENKSDLVSVIIPTYNRAETIAASIQSVLHQTYKYIEVIIIDDRSTDDTETVVSAINDTRIHYIKRTQGKQGPAASRNEGVKHSKGTYIAFNDSDDIWMPDKLEKQLVVFTDNEDENIGAVFCQAIHTVKSKYFIVPANALHDFEENRLSYMMETNHSWPQTLLLKRKVFDTIGYMNEDMTVLEDWDFSIRLAQQFQLKFVPEPLVIIFDTPESISKNIALMAESYELIYKRYKDEIKRRPSILSKHLTRIGNHYCLSGKMTQGKKYLKHASSSGSTIKSLVLYFVAMLGKGAYKNVYKIFQEILYFRYSSINDLPIQYRNIIKHMKK